MRPRVGSAKCRCVRCWSGSLASEGPRVVACSNCEAIQRMCDQRILAEQQRCLDLIETRETILVEAFVKHLRRTDRMVPNQRSFIFETDAQRVGRKKASMTRRATRALGVVLGLCL